MSVVACGSLFGNGLACDLWLGVVGFIPTRPAKISVATAINRSVMSR